MQRKSFSLFGARDERGRGLLQLNALLEGRLKLQHLVFASSLVALVASPVWSVTRSDATAPDYKEPTRFVANETWSGVGLLPGPASGSLISPCHVLTAAHVFFGTDGKGEAPPNPQSSAFTLVTPDPSDPENPAKFKRTRFRIAEIRLGPGYSFRRGHRIELPTPPGDTLTRNDIAIMKLTESVPEKIKVGNNRVPIDIYAVNKGEIEKENDRNLRTPAVPVANMVKVGFGARGNESGRQVGPGEKGEMFNIIDDFGDGMATFHIPPNPPDPAIRNNPPPKNTVLYDFDHLPRDGEDLVNSSRLLNTFAGVLGQPSYTSGSREGSAAGGDSGGPTFQYKDGKKFIVAVTSSGSDGLSRVGNVGYDTQVQKYKDWIAQVLGNPVTCPPVKREEEEEDLPSEYSGRAQGAKGTNGGTAVDAVDTGALPNRGGVHVAEGQRIDIPGGCIGNCDGQHPGMGDHPAIHNTTRAEGSASMSMSSVTFVDVVAGGYRVIADWLMPSSRATCTEQGPQVEPTLSIGWMLVYDPSGNLIYSESTGLTDTVRVQLAGGYDGEIIINETLSSRTGQSAALTVNGLHVAVRGGNDFVVASAHADVAGCPR
jgi:hypothetical protein